MLARAPTSPEAAGLRNFVLTNEHSPPVFRVNGPLSNLAEFAAAFGCAAGDAMVRPPEVRASIW
ncbi:MAG TPA: M13-type metalloendopeptidase [Longimicrobium sp.]|nr:M13-type metalloendopeptidase [Longimicrobium sp.]